MKIEGQNTKILNILKQLQQIYRQNTENQNANNSQNANSSLPSALQQLTPDLQQLILQIWLNSDLPLKDEYLEQLITLLENMGTAEETIDSNLIKAFTLLLQKKLPLSPLLLRSFAHNLNQSDTLSQLLTELIEQVEDKGQFKPQLSLNEINNNQVEQEPGPKNPVDSSRQENIPQKTTSTEQEQKGADSTTGKNTGENQKNILQTIFSKLGLKPELPPAKLARVLANYPQQMAEVITFINNSGAEEPQKIMEQLLGQYLINTDTGQQNQGLLLWLELPLFFDELQPTPLYLEVREGEEKKEQLQQEKNRNFKISFLIQLPRRGPVKADIFIMDDIIRGYFWASDPKTTSLIKKNVSRLKQNLNRIGFEMDKIEVDNVEEKKFSRPDFKPLPVEYQFSDQQYRHLDIKA